MVKHTFVVLAYKKSEHLELCIKSVLNQTYKSDVVIATSTPNKYIEKLAKKYNLKIKVNKEKKGIAHDFNFAVKCVNSGVVTIAHQDDIYGKDYSYNIMKQYKKYPKSSILFTDYYEIKNHKKEFSNVNLFIKRILLLPIRIKTLSSNKFLKRQILRFGNSICCPAVSFVRKNIPDNVFICNLKCNVDWYTWELLSRQKGNFIYISKKLMGHRIDEATTTTKIINEGIRTKEDLEILTKFWPKSIAKIINRVYKQSEKNNFK